MKRLNILSVLVIAILGLILTTCQFFYEDLENNKNNVVTIKKNNFIFVKDPNLSYDEVKEGAYIAGSMIYCEDDRLNQLNAGQTIRIRIDSPIYNSATSNLTYIREEMGYIYKRSK